MNLSKILKNLSSHWVLYSLVSIIVFSIFVRFYNYPLRYGLGDETVRDAAISNYGASNFQAPLTGPFSSAGPFTFGPWYYYQLIVARFLIPTPYAPWIYLSLTSLLCIPIAYLIGKLLLNNKFGMVMAFLTAASPSLVLAGTHLTNPNLSNIFAFLSVLFFLKVISQKGSLWWGFSLGIALGVAINIHYQMFGLLILPLLLLVFYPKKYMYVLTLAAGFLLTFIPLILFDLNNHGYNFRNILYYYTEGKNAIYVANRWLFYLRDFWPAYLEEVLGLPKIFAAILFLASFVFFGWLVIKKKATKPFILLILAFIFNFVLLRFYWGERYFGYLNYLRPFVMIITSFAVYKLISLPKGRNIKVLVIVLIFLMFGYFCWQKISPLLKKDEFSSHIYRSAATLEKEYPGKKFNLLICPGPGNTYYSSEVHSLLFALHIKGRLDENGVPISFINTDCYPTGVHEKWDEVGPKTFQRIAGTDMISLSSHTTASISAMKWQQDSLKLIYDTTTRWWFSEQP